MRIEASRLTVAFSLRPLAAYLHKSHALDRAGLAWAAAGVPAGFALAFSNAADWIALPYLATLAFLIGLTTVHERLRHSRWDRELLVCLTLACGAATVQSSLPLYAFGADFNTVLHRSFFAALAVFGVSVPATSAMLFRVLGRTPSARDWSRYPYILAPVAVALVAYGYLLGHLVARGADELSWKALITPFGLVSVTDGAVYAAGMRNQIVGTLLLIGLTSAISLPVGIGLGVYVTQYPGRIATAISFATAMLRATSVFIIGVAAFNLVQAVSDQQPGTLLSDLVRGSYEQTGALFPSRGSFVLASVFLSLLVIPVIARAAEEGLSSAPREMREGGLALGATEGRTITRLLLPWALPNIVTGLLIGAAETAGSVAVLLLIAGTGEHGLSPLDEATSLAYFVFQADYGPQAFTKANAQYQHAAALVLILMTFGFALLSMLVRGWLVRKFRGA